MFSSIEFGFYFLIEFVRMAVPLVFAILLIKCDPIRHFVNAVVLCLIGANLTTSVGLLIGQNGQTVTILLTLILSISLLRAAIKGSKFSFNKDSILELASVFVFVFILPTFFFFINSPELIGDYVFWLKRTLLVIFLISIGYVSSVLSINSVRRVALIVFLINCMGVIVSFFAPELFLLLIDMDDPMLEKGLNPMGGGFFLNPNGAALSVIFSFLAIVYVKRSIGRYKFVFLTSIFLLTLAIAGSRGGFLCGFILILFLLKNFGIFGILKSRRFFIVLFILPAAAIVLMNFIDIESIGGFTRIVDINNEGNLASNDSRWNALAASIRLAFENPVLGSGFGLRNILLDTQPHNMYAAYAVDIGIIGFIALPIFITLLTKSIIAKNSRFNFMITAFAILFMSLFDHEIIYSKQFAYLLFMAVIVYRSMGVLISRKA